MLARMLAQDGHTVVAASTADEALARLGEQRFDWCCQTTGWGSG